MSPQSVKTMLDERSSRKFREIYRGRDNCTPLRGRLPVTSPNCAKHRFQHKVDIVLEQLSVQVDSACCIGGVKKLQAGHSERTTNHPHQAAYQHGAKGVHGASPIAKYEAALIAHPN